ncbi:MAG: penicillin-binding protein activator, partial [Chloroflexi bacterium]|nr:penicillin-binding protein activator [Chloroflexota bacterium]
MHRAISIMLALLCVVSASVVGCGHKTTEVRIGALMPLTGSLSSLGEGGQAALEVAVEDVNQYLADIDAAIRVKVVTEDTETDPDVALEKLKTLEAAGVTAVIGPQSSAEVKAVMDYAVDNKVLVSTVSTAPSLAVVGDSVFRLCPDDTHQAEAVASLMWDQGIRVVVPMWRDDVWGNGLAAATKSTFESMGGVVVDGIKYDTATQDFTAGLADLVSKVKQAVTQYGASAVAVHLMAYEEAVPIMAGAEQQDSILSGIRWYGCDTTALNGEVVGNAQASSFAAGTGFLSPLAAEADSEVSDHVKTRVEEKIGRSPDFYSLAAYDALRILALAYLVAGSGDFDALENAFVETAKSYYGATGWTILNEAGDRRYGDYDFWTIREEDGSFVWARAAAYHSIPGSSGEITYESTSSAAPALKVLIVHSYHETWAWDQDMESGIVEGLSRKGYVKDRDYQLKSFYMDTKINYTTPEQIV